MANVGEDLVCVEQALRQRLIIHNNSIKFIDNIIHKITKILINIIAKFKIDKTIDSSS